MNEATIKALIIGLFGLACFIGGWAVEGWRMDTKISRIKNDHAVAVAKAATENAATLDVAQRRGDRLALQLAGWENTLTTFAEEKQREISTLVSGRRCLDSAVVRVLNQPSAPRGGGVASSASGVSLRAPAAVAAGADDGAFASDADVSGWIGVCQRGYDTCRGRLDAIADFYREDPRE